MRSRRVEGSVQGRSAGIWVWLGGVLLACAGLGTGCQQAPPDAVVAMRGWHVTLPRMVEEYERVNGIGSFDTTSTAGRERFARTLADREILLRLAAKRHDSLSGRYARQFEVSREKALNREFLRSRRAAFQLSPEAEAENLPRLGRSARIRQTLITDAERAREAGEALQAGARFEEGARRYGDPLSPRVATMFDAPADRRWFERTVRVDDRRLPPRLIVEGLLRNLQPGETAGPTTTTEGYVILQLAGYEPIAEAADTAWVSRAREALHRLAYMNVFEAWSDSLRKASGLQFHQENYPLIRERFAAFWDSIEVLRREGRMFDFQGMRAPIWRFSTEEQARPLFDLWGRTRSVGEYLGSLNRIDLDFWPTVGEVEKIQGQIEGRCNRLLLEEEAVKLGFPERPEFSAVLAPLRERYLLEQYYDQLTAEIAPPTPEELKAEFARQGDAWRVPDLVSFSALTYPTTKEARARATLQKLRTGSPLLWLELAPAEAAADTAVRYVAATELLPVNQPPPFPEWTAFFRTARVMKAGEISDLIPATTGGLAIVRVADLRPARPMTLEEAGPELSRRMIDARKDEAIEQQLERERKRQGVKVHLDRLGAPGGGGTGS